MLNIAHRGGAWRRPENTLASFRAAAAEGYDGAELDVQLSRDGEVVVFHDYRLNPDICRGADGGWLVAPTPRVSDLTLTELRAFDVGRADPQSAYARAHPELEPADGERIPALGEVVEIAKAASKPFRLFIELKTPVADSESSADPVALAEAVLRVLRAADYDRAVLIGFDWRGLLGTMAIEPRVECWFSTMPQRWFKESPPPEDSPPSGSALQRLRDWAESGASPWAAGYDAVKYGGSILRAIKAAAGGGWFPMHCDVTAASLAEARALGLKVGAWTVDDPAEMRRLIALGIDAICTGRPDLLAKAVAGTSDIMPPSP